MNVSSTADADSSQIMHPMDDLGDLENSVHPVTSLLEIAAGRTVIPGRGSSFDGFRLPNFFGQHDEIPSFAVLSFDGCQKVLSDTRCFSSDFFSEEYTGAVGRGLFCMDPPEHTKYRTLVQKAFIPRIVARWDEEIIRPAIARAFDDVVPAGQGDLASDIALKFPYEIISRILGFPDSDLMFVSDRITKMTRSTYDPVAAQAASVEMNAYVTDYIVARRTRLSDDFISALMSAEVDGENLSDSALRAFIFHVFPAGMETTFRGAANLAWLLLEHPGELEKLKADRSLVPAAIAEMLRVEGPASMFPRKVIAPTEIEGVSMAPGSMVYAMLAAANRDPSRWDRPEEFDITRPVLANLGFGYGVHACIGLHLARKELDLFANMMLDRMPNIRRDPSIADVPQILGWTLRSALSVPVVWDIPAQ